MLAHHLDALLRSLFGLHHFDWTRPLLATVSSAGARWPKTRWGLTRRATEVATWLTRAKSNPEIAVILGMERRTVEKHVEHILGKLGVENRTAAALLIVTEDEEARS